MEEYLLEGGFDPFDLNGDDPPERPKRCAECQSDQLYEVFNENRLAQGVIDPSYECTRCGAVMDEWGTVVKPGRDYKLPEQES